MPGFDPVQELVRLSRRFGRDLHQVQGAGGNVSIKTGPGEMLIKSSGARLKALSPRSGWVRARADRIAAGIKRIAAGNLETAARERAYTRLVRESAPPRGDRPSMEAGFHAGLPDRIVAHTHSNAAIILDLLGTAAAREEIGRFFPGLAVVSVPEKLPGLELSLAVLKKVPPAPVRLHILRHHGAVWSGEDGRVVLAAANRFEKLFQRRFALADYPLPHGRGKAGCAVKSRGLGAGWAEYCLCAWPRCSYGLEPLFPDFAVHFDLWGQDPDLKKTGPRTFALHGAGPRQRRDKLEIFHSHAVISTVLASLRVRPRPLGRRTIRAVKALAAEKARLEQTARLDGSG